VLHVGNLVHRVLTTRDDARRETVTAPMLVVVAVSAIMLRTMTTIPAVVQMLMSPMVPMTVW